MGLIRINLNHWQAAQELLMQTIYEKEMEAATINMPYRDNKSGSWLKYSTGKAAIWKCGNPTFQEVIEFTGVAFVREKVAGIHI